MADEFDKTEEPTGKKREESREKGQLGKSNDLTASIIVAISFLFLYIFGTHIMNMHFRAAHTIFGNLHQLDVDQHSLLGQVNDSFYFILKGTIPFLSVVFISAFLANVLQIGFLWTFKPMTPDFSKLNPIKGIQQKFSLKMVMMTLMNLAKTAIFSYIAYMVISNAWERVFRMTGQDIVHSMGLFGDLFFELALYIIIAMLVLALLDFAYQKWQNLQSMKMSKQEVKDEMKNYEGDPKIRQKRKQIQMQMSKQRMMKDVQDADVVITNPTHYSVAIKFDEDTMQAPVVVAKGVDLLALRIREIAKEHEVPRVENRALARSLYNTVEIGEYIPQKLFRAVAEILAYVYRMKGDDKRERAAG